MAIAPHPTRAPPARAGARGCPERPFAQDRSKGAAPLQPLSPSPMAANPENRTLEQWTRVAMSLSSLSSRIPRAS